MTHSASHLVRDVSIVGAVILLSAIAGLVIVGYGFALALVMMLGVVAALAIPFVAIYYEESDVPRDRR